jgi:hypothetical protein
MLKHLLAASALALAALAFSAVETPSAAFTRLAARVPSGTVTTVRWHGHHGFWRFGGHRFHRRVFIGGPVYAYGYGGGCAWLRHRALVTGSPYWWRRYRWCRGW